MPNFDCSKFCDRVLIMFGDRGQVELAREIGISQGTVSSIKLKKIKSPGADIVYRIAKYFGVSTDWLLGLTDVKINAEAENAYKLGLDVGYQAAKNQIMSFIEEMR